MKITWNDVTSYHQKERRGEVEPRSWELRLRGANGISLRILVHRHIHAPNRWFLTCHRLNVDLEPLGSSSAEGARAEAFDKIQKHVNYLIELISSVKVDHG